MFQALKKIIEKWNFSLKAGGILFLLIFTVLIVIPQVAGAGPAEWFINPLINFIFKALNALARYPLQWASTVLNWTMEGNFLGEGIGYQPHNNEIIRAGWGPIRNFANMFFIIALMVIGVATALRYKEYQAQKALPKLLLMALLINFTPAIAATIIDLSDAMMNAFLGQVTAQGISSGIVGEITTKMSILAQGANLGNAGQSLGKATFMLVFAWGATVIYLMYALLFAVRYIALWFLIILSPLAFISYVFPSTKKWWDQWWEQFIQWCIVGLPAAISLYLGKVILEEGLSGNPTAPGDFEQSFAEFMGTFTLPLIFLILGYLATLKTSAMGAEATINAGKTAARNAPGYAKKGAKGLGKVVAMGGRAVTTEGMRNKGRKKIRDWRKATSHSDEEIDQMGTFKSMGARMMRGGNKARRALSRYTARRTEAPGEGIRNEAEDLEDLEVGEKFSRFEGPLASKLDKIKLLLAAVKKGQLQEMRKMGMNDDEIAQTAVDAANFNPEITKDILDTFPEISEKVATNISMEDREDVGLELADEDQKQKYDLNSHKSNTPMDVSMTAKVTGELSTGDIPDLSSESFENDEVMEGVIRNWGSSQLYKAAQEHGKDFVEKLNEKLKEIINDPNRGPNFLENMNAELFDQVDNTPGPITRFSPKT